MDNQDQRRPHTQGHENHGVHVCHKCGWPFPNSHPSAKHRRAHKRICGTIEGFKLLVSEGQTHFNPSDDEHLFDDDQKTQGPKTLDTGNNEKVSGGIGEKSIRSGDEEFLDAVADFSDGGLSQGVKEPLQDSLDPATNQEIIHRKYLHRKYLDFAGFSKDNGSNATEERQPISKSRNDTEVQNPKILKKEKVEDGNVLELQGQLLSSTVNPLESSFADLKTEELAVVHTNGCFGLTSDSKPSKSEAMSDVLQENKIYAEENVRVCCLTSVAKETTLKEKDEVKAERDMVEIVVSSDNTVGETFGELSTIEGTDVVNSNYQMSDGALNLKEKNIAEFPSVMPQEDFPLEVDSAESINASINGIRVGSADMIELATFGDVKMLPERQEANVHVLTPSSCDDRSDVVHPQSEYEDHEGMVSLNSSSLHSSKALEQEQDDFKDSVTEENDFLINQGQLSEKREVLSQDMHALNSDMKKEQVNCELMAEEMHAEECIQVSLVNFKVESNRRLDETGASMNATKTEMNENNTVHFSEEQGSHNARETLQQINISEGGLMAASNESSCDASFVPATSETTAVISRDNVSHKKNITGKNDMADDGKCRGANIGNDTGSMNTLQPSNMYSEIKSSSVYISEGAVEMGKFGKYDIEDTQYTESPIVKGAPLPASNDFESPILSEFVIDGSERTPKDIECTNRGPPSGAQEDIKDDEINSDDRLNEDCNRIASSSATADSHQAQDEELLLKAKEGNDILNEDRNRIGGDHSLLSSLNVEPPAQHVSAVEDTQDGVPGRELLAVVAEPVQDQSGNNDFKFASSAINTSVHPVNRCDSLEANWGTVSVLSLQSDAQAATEAEALPSTEADKSNWKDPEAASERQQCEKTEMFEPPSFMTLVEPGHMVGPKAASEGKTESNKQNPDSTSSQAGWFPTLTHVTNDSEGRKRNEEIIAMATSKESAPLKSLLGDAGHSGKPKSPKSEKHSANQKNVKVADNGSGLTTVNSILGREAPAGQVVKGESAKQWNSPARYPADVKREKKKAKSRPHWIQLLCCSSVDTR